MSRKKISTKKLSNKPQPKPKAAKPDLVPLEKAPDLKSANHKRATKLQRMSALDAAVRVLTESDGPLSCPQMINVMETKGYWKSPGGKTPAATLYSAILREIAAKGNHARFKKVERGQFAPAKGA